MESIRTNTSGQRSQYLLLILLIVAFLPFLYISLFSHPAADDYYYSVDEGRTGFWKLFIDQYFSWSGRYSANFLSLLTPYLLKSILLYRLVSVFMIVLSFLGLFYFITAITGRTFPRIAVLNASLLYMLIFLTIMPSIAQGIYWYSGSCVYQAGIIFSFFYFGMICDYLNKRFILEKHMHLFFMLSCLVVALGFNEGNTLLLLSLHGLLVWLMIRNNKPVTPAIWVLLGTLAVFSAIMLLAPGNIARGKQFEESHNFFHSLLFTFLQAGRFGVQWGLSLPLILSSLLFISFRHQRKDKFLFFTLPIKNLVFTTVILAWIFFIFIFPAYWGTNILGQHRTVNVAGFFFLACWFLFLNSVTSFIPIEKLNKIPVLNSKRGFAFACAIILSVFITGNGYSVISDLLNGKIRKFDHQMTARKNFLSKSENKQTAVYITAAEERPAALFILELSEDSTYWINRCQVKYFGVKHIACVSAPE